MKTLNKILNLLCQRRLWSAFLSAIAVFGFSMGYPIIPSVCTALAGVLGLHSFIHPRK